MVYTSRYLNNHVGRDKDIKLALYKRFVKHHIIISYLQLKVSHIYDFTLPRPTTRDLCCFIAVFFNKYLCDILKYGLYYSFCRLLNFTKNPKTMSKNQIINAVYDYILARNYTICVRFDRKWYIDVAYI